MSQEGKYQKQSWIGEGERVDVFLGLNVAFGRNVAIKALRGGVNTSATERNTFYAEFEKWANLEHPRLVRIEDIDRARAWVIQEYLPHSIADQAGELSDNHVAFYHAFEQVLEGLVALHGMGLLHCNLKSSNIRLAADSFKLCDGRCVKIGFPGSLPKPRGSNRYLAPEMINEEYGNVGTASDIYVLGTILLEVLAGDKFESLFQRYVSGTPDTEMGWVRWHNSPDGLEPIHTLLPNVPQPLANLIDGMISKRVQVRYSSAERLLADLRDHRESIVHPQPVVPASSPAAAAHPNTQQATSSSSRPAGPASKESEKAKVKLIDRPGTPVYIRCLSGASAGSIFPAVIGDIVIGDGHQCHVRLNPEQYPAIRGREIKISLGNDGWQIVDAHSHPLIVDLKKSFERTPIRSGSIFRLSPHGPDFQFVVQGEHVATWQDIASDLKLAGPKTDSIPARLIQKRKAATDSESSHVAAGSAAPSRPQPAPPSGKSKPAAQAAPRPRSQPAVPARPAGPARPVAPAAAASQRSAPQPPSAPGRTGAGPGHESPKDAKPSLIEKIQTMDKDKRNNLILFVSLPVVAILIILFMPRAEVKKLDEQVPAAIENNEPDATQENPDTANTDPAADQETTIDANTPNDNQAPVDNDATEQDAEQ